MKVENLRSLIRESINEYIREIDNAGNQAALEAKIAATEGAIEKREKMANMEGIDEAYHDMLDKGKMKEIGGEVKALKKSLDKLKKQLDKLNSKSEPKAEVIKDEPVEEGDAMNSMKNAIVPEIELEEARSGKGKDVKKAVKKDEEVLNESFLKMQKLAGVITESQYNEKVKSLNEAAEDFKVGETYTASMVTDSTGKNRMDVKVKFLGKSNDGELIITPIQDVRYKNSESGQENEFRKDNQYGIEPEYLKLEVNEKVKSLNEEITVGGTYTASMPTSSDGKERIDVKVKVLGKDRSNEDKFIVTPLEDKDYTNAASGQQNRFEKGKQYGVEAEFIK
jgi:hypothetical protein